MLLTPYLLLLTGVVGLNEKNLIPFRSEVEARESGRKGGIKSGEARRRKRNIKALMKALLESSVTDIDIYNSTAALGFDDEEITYASAIVAAMVKEAADGNVKAFKEIRNVIGEDNDAERLKLQKKELQLKEQLLKSQGDKTETGTEEPLLYKALLGENDDDIP